jgi:hypothetical protein
MYCSKYCLWRFWRRFLQIKVRIFPNLKKVEQFVQPFFLQIKNKMTFQLFKYLYLLKLKTYYYMKKLSLLAIAALFVATSFTSCKKDYTCVCSAGSNGAVSVDASQVEYKKVKKSDAEDSCAALSTFQSLGGGSCSLK